MSGRLIVATAAAAISVTAAASGTGPVAQAAFAAGTAMAILEVGVWAIEKEAEASRLREAGHA